MLALQTNTPEIALQCRINQKRRVAQKHFICARMRHDWRVKPASLPFEQLLEVKELELYLIIESWKVIEDIDQ